MLPVYASPMPCEQSRREPTEEALRLSEEPFSRLTAKMRIHTSKRYQSADCLVSLYFCQFYSYHSQYRSVLGAYAPMRFLVSEWRGRAVVIRGIKMHLSAPREFPRYATARTIDNPPYTFLFNSENSFSGALFLLKNPPILVASYERKLYSVCKHIHHKPIPLLSDQVVPPTANTTAAAVSTTIMITRR